MTQPAEVELQVLQEAQAPALVAAAYFVRHQVFVVEQRVPVELERDEHDRVADHAVARMGELVIGTGRLLVEAAGFAGLDPDLGPVGHLGRLAVLRSDRGGGLGTRLVRALEQRAALVGVSCVYLAAQTPAVPFYEVLGYEAYGAEFDDAGLPHRHMWHQLP